MVQIQKNILDAFISDATFTDAFNFSKFSKLQPTIFKSIFDRLTEYMRPYRPPITELISAYRFLNVGNIIHKKGPQSTATYGNKVLLTNCFLLWIDNPVNFYSKLTTEISKNVFNMFKVSNRNIFKVN